jgi:hypothetical protein
MCPAWFKVMLSSLALLLQSASLAATAPLQRRSQAIEKADRKEIAKRSEFELLSDSGWKQKQDVAQRWRELMSS